MVLLGTASVACFFLGWGMMRPLRDAMGVERGFDQVPWLITATVLVSLAVSPMIAWGMKRLARGGEGADDAETRRRRRRVPVIVYRFFAVNLLLFALAKSLVPEPQRYMVGYAFYVWASVFNLTCVSAFWALMADVWPRERSLRVFGLVALGATLGVIGGGAWARWMAGERLPAWVFMLGLAAMLEAAVQGMRALTRVVARRGFGGADATGTPEHPRDAAPRAERHRGADGPLSGVLAVARSRYLLGASAYLLIYTITSTFFWLAQQRVVMEAGADQSARTALNATIGMWADGATLLVQLLLTGRIIRWIGQGGALVSTPLVTLAGLAWMGGSPTLSTLVPAVVARRSVHFAVDRPGREALYTVIPPEQKYTAKSFIDTFMYRGGDVLGAWIETALKSSSTPMLWFAGPLCLLGAALGWWLGGVARRGGSGAAGGSMTRG